jgi:hypothetical protein
MIRTCRQPVLRGQSPAPGMEATRPSKEKSGTLPKKSPACVFHSETVAPTYRDAHKARGMRGGGQGVGGGGTCTRPGCHAKNRGHFGVWESDPSAMRPAFRLAPDHPFGSFISYGVLLHFALSQVRPLRWSIPAGLRKKAGEEGPGCVPPFGMDLPLHLPPHQTSASWRFSGWTPAPRFRHGVPLRPDLPRPGQVGF